MKCTEKISSVLLRARKKKGTTIEDRNSALIELILKEILELKFLATSCSDNSLESFSELEQKIRRWLDRIQMEMVSCTFRLEKNLHQQFRFKCMQEGYSLHDAMEKLIQAYVDEKLIVQDKENSHG